MALHNARHDRTSIRFNLISPDTGNRIRMRMGPPLVRPRAPAYYWLSWRTVDPTAVPAPANDGMPATDEGMKWMIDFDAAEKIGMGIRVKVASADAAAGFDFVLVLGVKDSPAVADWSPRLAALFDAHRYTDGFAFLANGTPSNNTADAPSGFSSRDPGHEGSYQAERNAPVIKPGDGSNADLLTSALGLRSAGPVFANLQNAAAREQVE